MKPSTEVSGQLLIFQRNEITEYHIYKRLAKTIKSPDKSQVLDKIAGDELKHYNMWKAYTQQEVKPNRFGIWFYYLVSRLFGVTFGIKLMERGEEGAQSNYEQLRGHV